MLGQFVPGLRRLYRHVDVWEFVPNVWRPIYIAPQSPMLMLDDGQARDELFDAKIRFWRAGRMFRLWTWDGVRWQLTDQL